MIFPLCLLIYCMFPMELTTLMGRHLNSLGHEISDFVMDFREVAVPSTPLNSKNQLLFNLITVYKILYFLIFTNPSNLDYLPSFPCFCSMFSDF